MLSKLTARCALLKLEETLFDVIANTFIALSVNSAYGVWQSPRNARDRFPSTSSGQASQQTHLAMTLKSFLVAQRSISAETLRSQKALPPTCPATEGSVEGVTNEIINPEHQF